MTDEKRPGSPGDSTRAVHGGERDHRDSDAVTTPIYQTSTFWFPNSDDLKAYNEGRLKRDEYGRYGNPTWRAVERKVCALEGAEEAVLFASGMCAATTLFFARIPQNGHLVVTSDCYRRTRQFIQQYLVKLGVECTVIEPIRKQRFIYESFPGVLTKQRYGDAAMWHKYTEERMNFVAAKWGLVDVMDLARVLLRANDEPR